MKVLFRINDTWIMFYMGDENEHYTIWMGGEGLMT